MLGIYCRTSKARKEKYTIENQKENGIKCAQNLGLPYRIYVDDGISGTLDESVRGGLSDLFRDMKSKDLTAIYVIDQSRVERDTPTWHLFVSLCLNNKVSYYPGGSILDLDNPTNRMYAELMSVVNSYYAEITSRKVRDANTKKAKEGKTHGLKPYGYKRDELNNYMIFEDEAKIVRRMFDLSLSGIGAYSIANILNAEGIPTKFSSNFKGTLVRKDPYTKKIKLFEKSKIIWRGNVISDILKNPIYKGTRVWRRNEDTIEFDNGKKIKTKKIVEIITTENHVPPIVESELWDKVQRNFKNNKKNVGRKEQYNYLLNGIVKCSKCGSEYRGKKRPKGNDNAYKCVNKRYPSAKCTNRGLNIPRLETFIIKLLMFDLKTFKLFKGMPNKVSNFETYSKQLITKQKELDGISKRIKNIIFLASNVDENSDMNEIKDELTKLSKMKSTLIDEIQELEKKIKDETSGSFEEQLEAGSKVLEKLTNQLNNISNFDSIKEIVHKLIESISINFDIEEGKYILEIRLKGKQYPLYVESNRISDIWTFTDSEFNVEFNETNLPEWLRAITLVRKTKDDINYMCGIKIPKEKYINFN
jgi:DNA invertase Pin-like site-specific DNA recombinase/archaellum component FlaC